MKAQLFRMFEKNFLNFLFLQLLGLYCGSSTSSPLLGEMTESAKKHEFPFIVSLSRRKSIQKKENHLCGGALISKRHVLTSAHCVAGEHADDIVIVAGNVNVELGQVYEIKSWITYDDWAIGNNIITEYTDNDITIITLSKSVKDVKPGIISKLSHDEVIGMRVVTAGWGYINETTRRRPQSLRKARLTVLSLQEYKIIMEYQSARVEPATNKYYTIAYPFVMITCGDSGSPLLLAKNNEIVGVNDSSCDIDEPDDEDNATSFHIVLDYYRDFINDVTKRSSYEDNNV